MSFFGCVVIFALAVLILMYPSISPVFYLWAAAQIGDEICLAIKEGRK